MALQPHLQRLRPPPNHARCVHRSVMMLLLLLLLLLPPLLLLLLSLLLSSLARPNLLQLRRSAHRTRLRLAAHRVLSACQPFPDRQQLSQPPWLHLVQLRRRWYRA